MNEKLYHYKLEITKVIDGDTIEAHIDLGFGIWAKNKRFRLKGINASEVKGATKAQGLKAKDALERLLKERTLFAKTEKDKSDKYGRYIADIFFYTSEKDTGGQQIVFVKEYMINEGYAVAAYE